MSQAEKLKAALDAGHSSLKVKIPDSDGEKLRWRMHLSNAANTSPSRRAKLAALPTPPASLTP